MLKWSTIPYRRAVSYLVSGEMISPLSGTVPPFAALNVLNGTVTGQNIQRHRRGLFRSVADLQAAINRFLEEHNRQSKPFLWTKDPDKIIAAVKRGTKR
jgi:hypothetical protein